MANWIVNDKEKFVNPYNFINISEECIRKSVEDYENGTELITGYISCEIITRTPIFIPNVTNDNAFNEKNTENGEASAKTYDFYSYDDLSLEENKDRKEKYSKPVIPGSEIRGVIRSAFEAVTNSCMSTVDLERILYKRTPFPKNPGILKEENGEWYIQPAERVMIKRKDRRCDNDSFLGIDVNKYEEGERVYIEKSKKWYPKTIKGKPVRMPYTVVRISKNKFKNSIEGYLHKGEIIYGKHHESIFIPIENKRPVKIENKVVENLKKVLALYKDGKVNIQLKDKHKGYPEFEVEDNALIYYSDDYKYLSPACITKEVFLNSLNIILNKQGQHQPCTSRNNLCEGCYLFGMVGTSNEDSIGTRIRFTDALPEEKQNKDYRDYYDKEIILDELSSPKISATEFYMEKPDDKADFWTYDYYVNWENEKKIMPIENPKIRGRKFYWHSKKHPNSQRELNERNCMIRPVKKDVNFYFKVYFNNITKEQLSKLIWTLNIGDNDNQNCHKIGMGKPLGLGSIKIKVNEVIVRQLELEDDNIIYKLNSIPLDKLNFSAINVESQSVKEFIKITDFSKAPINVSYPKGAVISNNDNRKKANDEASHQWFIGNREYKGKGTKPTVWKTLPKILDKDISLPKYEKRK